MNEIQKNNRPEILVLGIGNTLLGDEGIGCHVVHALQKQPFPSNIRCVDGGTGGLHLMGEFGDAKEAVMIDAFADGQAPGTITRLTPHFSADYPRTLVAHDIGLKDLLDALQFEGKCPKITLFAISIEFPKDLSTELSPALQSAVPNITEQVKLYLADIGALSDN